MIFAKRWPGASWPRYLLAWWLPSGLTALFAIMLWRFRRTARRRVPTDGPLIVIANHASHLDPPLICCLVRARPIAILARQSLFDVPLLGPLIRFLGAVPLNRGRGATGAVRAAEAALAGGRGVLLFPEGTRSVDGEIKSFQPGAVFLARRTNATVLPCAIHGAYDVWPKGRRAPRLRGRILTRAGRPVPFDVLAGLSGDEAVELLLRRRVARQYDVLARWSERRGP